MEPDPIAPSTLRLVFPADVDEVVCNGRAFSCARAADRCTVDLNAAAEGWPDTVVLCQGVQAQPLFATLVALAFENGLPVWTPNLDRAGQVEATSRSTAVATAFLSPYLTSLYPETARALLAQLDGSPYLDPLVAAVGARDDGAAAAAIPSLVIDVLSQGTVQEALTNASRSLGMTHIEIEQVGGYVTLDSRLGTPVDHMRAPYALDPACRAPRSTSRRWTPVRPSPSPRSAGSTCRR